MTTPSSREIKQIPVFSEHERRVEIGYAEISQDGSLTIRIRPEMLSKNDDLFLPEQIRGFFVHYEYHPTNPFEEKPVRWFKE
jgi:hypothetical protein